MVKDIMSKKGFKVTNISRDKKIGVAAVSLKEFLKKSCEKLSVKDDWQSCRCYVAEDGTLVDEEDYFGTLPAQTLLVVVRSQEKMKTEFEYLYDLIRSTKHEYLEAGENAQQFMTQNISERLQKLQLFLSQNEEKDQQAKLVSASERENDPEWFQGIDTNEKTKEAYMNRKAKDRMKGYFYKVKQLLLSSDLYVTSRDRSLKGDIENVISGLRRLLESNSYNGCYFDRGCKESQRLCDTEGSFLCGGAWSREECQYGGSHRINPYRTREERLLFQTWNLDHRIELSRSIVPGILLAARQLRKHPGKCYSCRQRANDAHISANWYYRELFTTDNLKLVHIVCHDKSKHAPSSTAYIVCQRCWKNELAGSK